MKKLISLVTILFFFGCGQNTTPSILSDYNFEALKDTLCLNDNCVFIKECSPLYSDDNPYELPDQEVRVKTLFYRIVQDSDDNVSDTVVYAVLRNNQIIFWGKNEKKGSARELIEWTIKNREKI